MSAGCTELNEEERAALAGLSHLQRCAYVFGIRWFMDSKTRISGIKRGISYQSIAEELYVEPVPGIQDTGTPSRMQIRRAVAALEKAGLISNKSIGKNLILECVLARQSNYVQNKADTRPTQQADTQADTEETMKNINKINNLNRGDTGQADTQADIAKIAQADTPPLSIKLNNNNNKRQQFLDLFTAKRFPASYLADARTHHMLNMWEEANITIEEVITAIKHGDNEVLNRKGRVTVPWFYQDIPFQLRTPQEALNATTRQSQQRTTYEELRERRAKWREKCEQEEQDGCEDNRDII